MLARSSSITYFRLSPLTALASAGPMPFCLTDLSYPSRSGCLRLSPRQPLQWLRDRRLVEVETHRREPAATGLGIHVLRGAKGAEDLRGLRNGYDTRLGQFVAQCRRHQPGIDLQQTHCAGAQQLENRGIEGEIIDDDEAARLLALGNKVLSQGVMVDARRFAQFKTC